MTISPSDVLEELALLEQSLEGMEWKERKGKKPLPPIPGKQTGPLLQRVALAPKIDFDRGKMSQALALLQDGMESLLKPPTLSDLEASLDALAEDLQPDNTEPITDKTADTVPVSLEEISDELAQLANLDLLPPVNPTPVVDPTPPPVASFLSTLSLFTPPDAAMSSNDQNLLQQYQPTTIPEPVPSSSPSPAPTRAPTPDLAVASPSPQPTAATPLTGTPVAPSPDLPSPALAPAQAPVLIPIPAPVAAPVPTSAPVQSEPAVVPAVPLSPLDDPAFWTTPDDDEPSLVSTGSFESTWVPNMTIAAASPGAATRALDGFADDLPEEFSLDALLASGTPGEVSDDQVFFNPGRFSQRITVDYRQTTRRETISENPGFTAPLTPPSPQNSSSLHQAPDSSFLNTSASGKDSSLAFGLYGSTITVEATLPSGQVKRYEISTSATVDQLRKKIWILSGQSFDKDAVLLYQRTELAGFRKFTRAHPGIQADMEKSGIVPVTLSLQTAHRKTLPPGALSPLDLEIEQTGRPSLPDRSGAFPPHAWATPSPRTPLAASYAPEPKTSLAIGRRPSGSQPSSVAAAASPDRTHYIQLPRLLNPNAASSAPVTPTSPTTNTPPSLPATTPSSSPFLAAAASTAAPASEKVPLILPEDGYTIEPEPQHLVGDLKTVLTLYKPEDNIAYYRTWFLPVAHTSLMGRKGDQIVIVSFTNEAHNGKYKILVWQAKGTSRHLLEGTGKTVRLNKLKSIVLDFLKPTVPLVGELSLEVIREASFSNHLLTVEGTQVVQAYKFGLLYAKEGQTIEEEMFSNTITSPEYEDFLRFLGDQVTLSGWDKYRAGLDCKGTNTTGTHSVYTQFMGYEVMFHVSTLLPYSTHDMQQLERKRHIGNDIVVLVFMDGRTPYHPGTISSEFNHVFVVVQPVTIQGEQCYKIGCVSKDGVPAIPPALDSLIFKKNNSFRYLLLTKLINSERCSYGAPVFAQKITRTRKSLLKEIYTSCKGED